MYNNYPDIHQAIIAFGQFLRKEGMNVGVQENLEALLAAESGLIEDRKSFFYACKALYCCNREESEVFEKLFEQFWTKERTMVKGKVSKKGVLTRTNVPASIVMLGMGEGKEESEESQETTGANGQERLRKTDFAKVADIDSEYLEELAFKLWRQMSLRIKRRMKMSQRKGQFDIRKTIRKSISHGGDPIKPVYKQKRKRKQRLVVLLDVSGSMDKYSFFLLRFVCALRSHFETIEAFLFSTQLVRISDYLSNRELELTLAVLAQKAHNWSSGTTIGDCLNTFNDTYARQCLAGQSTVVILSDGLDTGEPERLELELSKIRLRCNRLIWLNPLKGMKGYTPTARGMKAAIPHLDEFQSAHNLESLLELEQFLIHV